MRLPEERKKKAKIWNERVGQCGKYKMNGRGGGGGGMGQTKLKQ